MKKLNYHLISLTISWVPYLLVGWVYMDFTDGKINSFWLALGTLVGIRAIFGIVEFVIGIIQWRLFGKKFAVQTILTLLRNNKFPMRENPRDKFYSYLARITENYEPQPSPEKAAKDLEDFLLFLDEFTGWGLWSWRLSSAGDQALDIYSPSARA